MPSREERQRQGKKREIMEHVKQNYLNAFHIPKKENPYQHEITGWGNGQTDKEIRPSAYLIHIFGCSLVKRFGFNHI
jgi:hypothetical protein